MMSGQFCRYDLRTTDVDAARLFYAAVVGLDLDAKPSSDEPPMLAVWPLHEQALARGAPAHWLGSIGVGDVDATVRRLLALGGAPLGPLQVRAADGVPFATLRDPGGAVVAVRGDARSPVQAPVAWHQLHTRDLERAWAVYSEVFGWTIEQTVAAADLEGGHRMFAWGGAGVSHGSMANTAQWPGVHVHWMYYFRVADLDAAAAQVQEHGGLVVGSASTLPNGSRVWPCEDAQGAAFGLYQD
jgi:predicted enzyme related to lactoylglutathione lyase